MTYIRQCKECGKIYRPEIRRSRFCDDCIKIHRQEGVLKLMQTWKEKRKKPKGFKDLMP